MEDFDQRSEYVAMLVQRFVNDYSLSEVAMSLDMTNDSVRKFVTSRKEIPLAELQVMFFKITSTYFLIKIKQHRTF